MVSSSITMPSSRAWAYGENTVPTVFFPCFLLPYAVFSCKYGIRCNSSTCCIIRQRDTVSVWLIHKFCTYTKDLMISHQLQQHRPYFLLSSSMRSPTGGCDSEQTRLFSGQTVVKCMYGPASTYENTVAVSWPYFWPHFGDRIYRIVLPYAQALGCRVSRVQITVQ